MHTTYNTHSLDFQALSLTLTCRCIYMYMKCDLWPCLSLWVKGQTTCIMQCDHWPCLPLWGSKVKLHVLCSVTFDPVCPYGGQRSNYMYTYTLGRQPGNGGYNTDSPLLPVGVVRLYDTSDSFLRKVAIHRVYWGKEIVLWGIRKKKTNKLINLYEEWICWEISAYV